MKSSFIGLFLIPIAATATAVPVCAQSPPANPLSVTPVTPAQESPEAAAVRSKLEALGYSEVTDVERDPTGLWHARANRSGNVVVVTVDKGGRVHLAH